MDEILPAWRKTQSNQLINLKVETTKVNLVLYLFV